MKWCPVLFNSASRGRAWPGTTILLLACSVCAASVQARESDLDQPIDIRADRSQFDERAGLQVLDGNVEISQGTMLIRADRVEVQLEDGRLARIEGTGSPLVFEQDNEAGERMQGAAARIAYDAIEGRLVLEGGATLEQPRQALQSERIVFDARTQTVSAEGGPGGRDGQAASGDRAPGRVTIRLEPPARDRP